MQRPIGQRFDDPDAVFDWLHSVVVGVPVLDLACRSGLAERLLTGPATIDALAEVTGFAPDKLARIVRYMARHELLRLYDDGTVTAVPHTATLVRWAGLWQQMINTMHAGSALTAALREGRTGFEERFGAPVFDHFAAHPELGARFGEFMTFMSDRTMDFALGAHRFAPFAVAVDVGGSSGALLQALLEHYPGSRGVLFDRPEVAARARAAIAGKPLAARIECVGGSFFEAVPAGDLILLKQILHDWDDEECRTILRAVRRAIAPGGRLAVIDHLLPDSGPPGEADSTDIAMMVWATGRERMLREFEALFEATGFALDRVTSNPAGHSVIEALAV